MKRVRVNTSPKSQWLSELEKRTKIHQYMKRIELFFLGVLVPLDYLALVAAALSAYVLRFDIFSRLLPTTATISFDEFMGSAVGFSLLFIIIFAIAGLYAPTVRRRLAGEFPRIILAVSTGIAVVIVTIFFQREFFASRFIVLVAWAFAILYVFAARSMVRIFQYVLVRSGIGVHRLAIIGETPTAAAIEQALLREHRWAQRVSIHFPRWNEQTKARLIDLRKQNHIDDVLLADPSTAREDIVAMQDFCDDHHLGFRYTADLLQTASKSIELITLAGVPVVAVKRTPLEGWGAIAKRTFDLVFGLILLIILSPLLILIAIAIKLDSKGSVLFTHTRIGQFGEQFRFYKFRSMKSGAHQQFGKLMAKTERPGLLKLKADPRVTSVGRFLRRASMDELPQLFNVIGGSMSLVGPRPHLPEEVAKYAPHYRRVHAVKPGITGFAQISGRADLSLEDEIRLDNFYIEHWSPYLDLIILVKTPFVVLARTGAY